MSRLGNALGRKHRLADWLPWLEPVVPRRAGGTFRDALKAADTVTTKPGGLLRCARVELPDFESQSVEGLEAHHGRIEALCARFGSGWSVWLDQWRWAAPGYLPANGFGGNVAAQRIDASRARQFTDLARPIFANAAFLAVHYLPRRQDAVLGWLTDRDDTTAAAHVAFFQEQSTGLIEELKHSLRSVTLLCGDDLASYLQATVTYRPGPAMMPAGFMAPQMAVREWRTDDRLRIDGRHVATVELRNFGSPDERTGEALHELDFECRWTMGFHGLDPDQRRAELEEVRKGWELKRKGFGGLLTEAITRGRRTGRTNGEADRSVAQLEHMQGELLHRPFALAHCNVHVWVDAEGLSGDEAEDEPAHRRARRAARERAVEVESLLLSRGLGARVATLNDVWAPLGDMPGNVSRETRNVRRTRVEIAAVTRLAPVTGVSTGAREDWRFGGSALLAGLTRRGTPFYWSLNAPGSDSAHTAVVGKTGSGKSACLALMAAQFLRYGGAKVVVFDRKRSFLVPCLALGGDWVELGGGGAGVQPLRAIDRPEELAWAQGWVERALRVRGLEPTQRTGEAITEALRHVADLAPDERTLSLLHAHLGADADARHALSHYLDGQGPYGELFDGAVDSYGEAAVLGVETQDVVHLEHAAPLAVAAMFRAVRRDRLTGDAPKLVVVDEAWALLRHPLFADEIEGWAREMRKLKAVLVLATQSLADLATERARVIFDQIANRLYLPHAEAMRPQTRQLYEAVGLTEEQVRLLTTAQPKGEYLLQTEEAMRLVRIRLEDEALRLCGASSPADHARAFELLEQGMAPGAAFTEAWLSRTTEAWLAERSARVPEAAG